MYFDGHEPTLKRNLIPLSSAEYMWAVDISEILVPIYKLHDITSHKILILIHNNMKIHNLTSCKYFICKIWILKIYKKMHLPP
jgi:hypothetical protein